MNKEQKAAYVYSQSVAAMCELEAMKVNNKLAEPYDHIDTPHYPEDFEKIAEKYGISHNQVVELFQEADA